MLVVDASVLVKYVSREEGWQEARKLISMGVYTVKLALKETANAMWKKAMLGEVNLDKVLEIIKGLYNAVSLIDQDAVLPEAVEVALKHRITVYDALYIAAAKKLKASLATADEKQAEAAKNEGVDVVLI